MSEFFSTPRISAPAPTVAAPTPMPDTQDPQVLAAQRRALADASVRGGRASTIMGGGDPGALGNSTTAAAGDTYANSTLGGGR